MLHNNNNNYYYYYHLRRISCFQRTVTPPHPPISTVQILDQWDHMSRLIRAEELLVEHSVSIQSFTQKSFGVVPLLGPLLNSITLLLV